MLQRLTPVLLLLLLAVGVAWRVTTTTGAEQRSTQTPVRWELDTGKAPRAVLLSRSGLTQVRRAPLCERLSVLLTALALPTSIVQRAFVSTVAGDRSETLRRVQTRRRVPRMNSDDPPWS